LAVSSFFAVSSSLPGSPVGSWPALPIAWAYPGQGGIDEAGNDSISGTVRISRKLASAGTYIPGGPPG